MGRTLSSVLRQEWVNLDKDADSHKSAMKALKSYVKDMDSKAIPVFLTQVSETKESGSSSGEYTISLFETLARVHGVKIVPHIDNIMSKIIKTLASSSVSLPLQQACSKVVSAVARYGIDPGTTGEKKRHIIHSLCKPLLDSLLGPQESLASGAALCLKALVDCDNWRCVSDEMVNKVCQNVAVALEVNSNETYSHMSLVIALAKHNSFIVEAYARLLVQSGLRILDLGIAVGNSQKRLLAIQMLNFLMKNLDPESMYSEVELIAQELEKCQCDKMHFVKMAAYEAIQTAKKIGGEKDSKSEKSCGSVTGSNFTGRNLIIASDRSLVSASTELQPFLDPIVDSRCSMAHASYNSGNDGWSVTYKLKSHENGKLDEEDDLLCGVAEGSNVPDSPLVPYWDHIEDSIWFQQGSSRNCFLRSATPSPERSCSYRRNVDDNNGLAPPRNLNSNFSDNQTGSFRATCSRSFSGNPKPRSRDFKVSPTQNHQNGFVHDLFDELRETGELYGDGILKSEGATESVSSTDDNDIQLNHDLAAQTKPQMLMTQKQRGPRKSVLRLGLSVISIVAAGFASFVWVYVQDEVPYLVPT